MPFHAAAPLRSKFKCTLNMSPDPPPGEYPRHYGYGISFINCLGSSKIFLSMLPVMYSSGVKGSGTWGSTDTLFSFSWDLSVAFCHNHIQVL